MNGDIAYIIVIIILTIITVRCNRFPLKGVEGGDEHRKQSGSSWSHIIICVQDPPYPLPPTPYHSHQSISSIQCRTNERAWVFWNQTFVSKLLTAGACTALGPQVAVPNPGCNISNPLMSLRFRGIPQIFVKLEKSLLGSAQTRVMSDSKQESLDFANINYVYCLTYLQNNIINIIALQTNRHTYKLGK